MLSIVINMKIMKWYKMYMFFVDLGVVVYVDTEWVIWDFDTKYEISLGLGLEIKRHALVLALTTVLFTPLPFGHKKYKKKFCGGGTAPSPEHTILGAFDPRPSVPLSDGLDTSRCEILDPPLTSLIATQYGT